MKVVNQQGQVLLQRVHVVRFVRDEVARLDVPSRDRFRRRPGFSGNPIEHRGDFDSYVLRAVRHCGHLAGRKLSRGAYGFRQIMATVLCLTASGPLCTGRPACATRSKYRSAIN